jgi:hypothetical protein
MADVPVGPAVARSRSIGGRLNSVPGYARRLGVAEELVDLGKSDTAAFLTLPPPYAIEDGSEDDQIVESAMPDPIVGPLNSDGRPLAP